MKPANRGTRYCTHEKKNRIFFLKIKELLEIKKKKS